MNDLNEERRIGVFVCHCGTNIAGKIDVARLAERAGEEQDVVYAVDNRFMCSEPGQATISDAIKKHDLNRVVVAACSPRMHELTFQEACLGAGLNPFLMQVANVREHVSWVTEEESDADAKALALVRGAIRKAALLAPLKTRRVEVNQSTLIIGGGIAGIQAALDLADGGKHVYLVEREQSIGGHMAQLDKTFPTLDCSACILTPKMVAVGKHKNIDLFNYSEVERVDGSVGHFRVTVRRKARGVDDSKCTGCGDCIEKCPRRVTSEFNVGMSRRRAIYTDFPQAVPNHPVIDKAMCLYQKKGKCKLCIEVCQTGAIDLDAEDEIIDLEVGNIIVATGYEVMKTDAMSQYGHGKFDNVLEGLEFERMVSATGPTGGKIQLKNGEPPKSAAIIHCVGSRDVNFNEYCSRVCCMYSLKFAHLLREKTGAEVFEFYIDMRCFGKGYEKFYYRNLQDGVHFVRAKPGYVTRDAMDESEEGKLIVVAEDTTLGRVLRFPVEMVILAQALEPRHDAHELAQKLRIFRSWGGFYLERHPKLAPAATATEGVYVAGCCQSPKDIPDTVAQGSTAAAAVLSTLARGYVTVSGAIAEVDEDACSACKLCLSSCPYSAISMRPEDVGGRAMVSASLCKGCGTCAATCPSGAIVAHQFTEDQLSAEIRGALL